MTETPTDILMGLGMCPCCGTLQMTIPTDTEGNVVTVGMDHEHARRFVIAMIELCMRFTAGTLGEIAHRQLPVKCCEEVATRPN